MDKVIQDILNHCEEYAKDLLNETKEFYPFGAFTDNSGQVHPLEFDVDKKNIPQNGKVINSLQRYCEGELEEGNILAYGLTYEVQLQIEENQPPIDAIAVDIVNTSEEDIPVFYFPFKVSEDKVEYDQGFAVKR